MAKTFFTNVMYHIHSKPNNAIFSKVGLLVGDFMEKIQIKYEEEIKRKAEADGVAPPLSPWDKSKPQVEEYKEDNKYAGFFSG